MYSPHKASLVERVQKTLKTKISRSLTHTNTNDWVTVLPKIIKAYNNTIHSYHKLTPQDARKKSNWQSLFFKNSKSDPCTDKSKLKVGDTVRISLVQSVFKKEYDYKWSRKVYTIHSVDRRQCPIMYTLIDYLDDVVEGKFYKEELQQIGKPLTYPIEKIIRKVGNRFLVKFLDYPENYWVMSINK